MHKHKAYRILNLIHIRTLFPGFFDIKISIWHSSKMCISNLDMVGFKAMHFKVSKDRNALLKDHLQLSNAPEAVSSKLFWANKIFNERQQTKQKPSNRQKALTNSPMLLAGTGTTLLHHSCQHLPQTGCGQLLQPL